MRKFRIKKNSIFIKVLVPMLVVMLLQVSLLGGSIFFGGTINQLEDNAYELFGRGVSNRKEYLQGMMGDRWSRIEDSINSVNSIAKKYNIELAADMDNAIEQKSAATDSAVIAMLGETSDSLISILDRNFVTGAFIVLLGEDYTSAKVAPKVQANTSNTLTQTATMAKNSRFALYIRDSAPETVVSNRSDLTILCAPLELSEALLKKSGIASSSTDMKTKLELSDTLVEERYNYITKPYDAAKRLSGISATDLGYWNKPFVMVNPNIKVMTFSVPLMLTDGKPYGVMGIEVDEQYLKRLLPISELSKNNDASYVLGINHEESQMNFDVAISRGFSFDKLVDNNTSLVLKSKTIASNNIYEVSNLKNAQVKTVGAVQYFNLYNKVSPFASEKWGIIGIMSKDVLLNFSQTVFWTLLTIIFVSLVMGTAIVFIVSFFVSEPIVNLSSELKEQRFSSNLKLGKVNIYEIDELINAIDELSHDLSETASREKQKLQHERDFDILTSLLNRRAFHSRAQDILRDKPLEFCAFIMLDLDNLKHINDTYGHDCGDEYIRKTANVLTNIDEEKCLVGRMSGDEFYIFYHHCTSREDIYCRIRELKNSLFNTVLELPDKTFIKIRASAGIAWYPQDTDDFDELIMFADYAMYEIKHSKKGEIGEFNRERYDKGIYVLKNKEELNRLIEESLVTYHFQPIVDIMTGEIYGYEALMRSLAPAFKSPTEILTVALAQSKLSKIEELTWLNSLKCFSNNSPPEGVKLFINTLPDQEMDEAFVAKIEKDFPNHLSNIVIEFTENGKLDSGYTTIKKEIIRKWQCLSALDDYGSGYNSDSALIELEPDFIKMDMWIIRNIDSDEKRQNIFANLAKYAKQRNIKIIAEGVETRAEMEMVKRLGADYIQGYYAAKPDPLLKQISGKVKKEIRSAEASEEARNNEIDGILPL